MSKNVTRFPARYTMAEIIHALRLMADELEVDRPVVRKDMAWRDPFSAESVARIPREG